MWDGGEGRGSARALQNLGRHPSLPRRTLPTGLHLNVKVLKKRNNQKLGLQVRHVHPETEAGS